MMTYTVHSTNPLKMRETVRLITEFEEALGNAIDTYLEESPAIEYPATKSYLAWDAEKLLKCGCGDFTGFPSWMLNSVALPWIISSIISTKTQSGYIPSGTMLGRVNIESGHRFFNLPIIGEANTTVWRMRDHPNALVSIAPTGRSEYIAMTLYFPYDGVGQGRSMDEYSFQAATLLAEELRKNR